MSKNLNDEIMAKMFEFIHALYVDSGKEKLNSILNYIELKSMLSRRRGFSCSEVLIEDHKVAVAYYEKVLYARKQIQREDCLYET
ncbi:hypothetical protein [Bacillus spizizenii]